MKKIILILFIFTLNFAMAGEVRTLGRSPRALLMGDAYTAIADDEYTLFYNPAILARHSSFSFYPINPQVTGTNPLKYADEAEALGEASVDTLADSIMGLPIHVGYSLTPGFKIGTFGISLINNSHTNINLQNRVNPTLDIDHRVDRGFTTGFAFQIAENLAMGMSFKYLQRESIYDSYYLYGTTFSDAISQDEIADILDDLGRVKGSGYGFDLGFDYVKNNGASTLMFGLSFMDLYTKLTTDENDEDREVQAQPLQANFGSALVIEGPAGFDVTFSADIRHLEQRDVEMLRRLYLGAELGLTPAISLLAGLLWRQAQHGLN